MFTCESKSEIRHTFPLAHPQICYYVEVFLFRNFRKKNIFFKIKKICFFFLKFPNKKTSPLKCIRGDELKLVFPQIGLEPDFFQDLDFNNFLLQPMSGSNWVANTVAAAEYCYVNPNWLLSLQVHKFADIP